MENKRHERLVKELQKMRSTYFERNGCLRPWKIREEDAELTGLLDYGCKFGNDGQCTRSSDYALRGNGKTANRNCCVSCYGSIGYLRQIPSRKVKEIVALFLPEMGFWRPTGCALPRKWRSDTCLSYACNEKARLATRRLLRHDMLY
jgi:hypothetical protein